MRALTVIAKTTMGGGAPRSNRRRLNDGTEGAPAPGREGRGIGGCTVDDTTHGMRPVAWGPAVPVTLFSFSLALSLIDGRPGLTVAGDIDACSAREFADAIDLLSDITDGHVWIDMAGVTFIDSTGLHVLLGALARLQPQDRRVELLEPSPVVLRLLELCGVAAHFVVLGRSAVPESASR